MSSHITESRQAKSSSNGRFEEELGYDPSKLDGETVKNMSKEEMYKLAEYLKKNCDIKMEKNLDLRLHPQIDSFYPICKRNWAIINFMANRNNNTRTDLANHITRGESTLGASYMAKAGEIIGEFLSHSINLLGNKIKILDPFAGNGVASKIIYENSLKIFNRKVKLSKKTIQYIASDFQDLSSIVNGISNLTVDFSIDCIDSINKYQEETQVLALVCPPPYNYNQIMPMGPDGFSDYYAIKLWTELDKKVIIFIGEMGYSDGTEGIYWFMMNHPIWKLVKRELLIKKQDMFGRWIEKEIFIFKNSKFSK